jgi:hypothetical protein
MIAGFANVVLRRQIQRGGVVGLKLPNLSEENQLPLLLAFRSALNANLEERRTLQEALLDHEQELRMRRERLFQVKLDLKRHKNGSNEIRSKVDKSLRDLWTANPAWISALLHGFPPGEGLLRGDEAAPCDGGAAITLQWLQNLTNEQESRLERWATSKPCSSGLEFNAPNNLCSRSSGGCPVKFDKHQNLNLQDAARESRESGEGISRLRVRYQAFLQQLYNDLKPPNGRKNDSLPAYNASRSFRSQGAPSLSDVVNSDNRTQLIADLDRSQDNTPEQRPSNESVPPSVWTPPVKRLGSVDNPLPNDSFPVRGTTPIQSSSISANHITTPVSPGSPHMSPTGQEIEINTSDCKSPPTTPVPNPRITLQERTRMSLAGALRDLGSSPSPLSTQPAKPMERGTTNIDPSPLPSPVAADLAQRTRKSMSLLTTITERKTTRRKSGGPRLSQLYPVNPFETPRKSSLQKETRTPGSGESTPREKLFSDDADMSSVFKSRPKIALSPMISPDCSMLEEDSILVARADAMDLHEARPTGSPT